MTMRERIARAIEKTIDMKANGWSLQKEASYAAADAVLAELRTPTDAMLVAAEDAVPALACFAPKENSPSYIAWISAIDAAGAE
jgi:hypothetical protein